MQDYRIYNLILYSIIIYNIHLYYVYILFPLLHITDTNIHPLLKMKHVQYFTSEDRDTCCVCFGHSELCITSLLLSCLNISLLFANGGFFLIVLLSTVCLLYSNVNVTFQTERISLMSLRWSREREAWWEERCEVWRGCKDILFCRVCPPQYVHMETQQYSDELQSGNLCYWKGQSYRQWHVHLQGNQPDHENGEGNDIQTRSDR